MPGEDLAPARARWPAATGWSRASRAAPRPTPGGWSAWAGSPTRARTARSCSSPARREPRISPAFESWTGRVARLRRRARRPPSCAACASGSSARARSSAFHWRGVPDEDAARTRARGHRARGRGRRARLPLGPQGARDPPAGAGRQGPGRARAGRARAASARRSSAATTRPTSTPSRRSTRCVDEGALDARVQVGVALRRGPGRDRRAGRHRRRRHRGLRRRARGARRRMRFPDFLRTCVLLFARRGDGARGRRDRRRDRRRTTARCSTSRSAGGRSRRVAGLWLGRRPEVTQGIGRAARRRPHAARRCPSSSPARSSSTACGRSRVFTIGSGAVAFLIPQVPAIAAGYVIAAALAWRKQSRRGRGDRGPRRRALLRRADLAVQADAG